MQKPGMLEGWGQVVRVFTASSTWGGGGGGGWLGIRA